MPQRRGSKGQFVRNGGRVQLHLRNMRGISQVVPAGKVTIASPKPPRDQVTPPGTVTIAGPKPTGSASLSNRTSKISDSRRRGRVLSDRAASVKGVKVAKGKPSKGTPKDKRLKANKSSKSSKKK